MGKKRKNCISFKSMDNFEGMHNKILKNDCSNCVYFSSKNCRLEASNDLEPDTDFI